MSPEIRASALIVLAGALASACGRADGQAAQTAAVTAATAAVDTVQPLHVAVGQFREGLREPAALAGGESSVDGLVARWARAVAAHDTATLRRLILDRAEFAWLYYPASAFSRRPLYQPPEIVWFRLRAASEKGIVRVLRRHGGTGLAYRGVSCARPPRSEGANRIWEYCALERGEEEERQHDVLFGGIIERDGRFKFISYANQY